MAKHLKEVMVKLGGAWADLTVSDTPMNLVLSSPVFRHADDATVSLLLKEIHEFEAQVKGAESSKLDDSGATPASPSSQTLDTSNECAVKDTKENSKDGEDEEEEPLRRATRRNQVNEDTLFDTSKLLLLGILFCKGSRVGKTTLLFPLVTRQIIQH